MVLAASHSGNTEELLRLVDALEHRAIPLVALTGNDRSPLASRASLHLSIAVPREAGAHDLVPTASTAATLALGDALAMAVVEARGFTRDDFARLHPAGQLGRRLLSIGEIMHTGDALPRCAPDTSMRDVIYEISAKGFGVAAVTDGGKLIGCITDGDLRRLLERTENPLNLSAADCMSGTPRTLSGDTMAQAALSEMETHKISSLFVVDAEGALAGLVHLHDLLALGLGQ